MLAILQTLWKLLQGRRAIYGAALACLAVSHLINYFVPLIGSVVLDHVLQNREAPAGSLLSWTRQLLELFGPLQNHLSLAALWMLLLSLVAGVFQYGKGRFVSLAADNIARDLKDRLYLHVQRLQARYHDTHETGDLVQRCTSDVDTTQLFLSTQVVEIGNAVLMVGLALPLMLQLDPRMTLISLSLLAPIILYAYFYFRQVKKVFLSVDEAEGKMTTVIQENLTGIRVVRAFARRAFEEAKFAEKNRTYRDAQGRMIRRMAWYWGPSDLFSLSQIGLSLFAGAWFLHEGKLTVGELYAFLAYLNMFLWPVRQMGRILTDLGKAGVALGRIGEIMDEREEDAADGPLLIKPPEFLRGKIEFHRLSFSHGDHQHALKEVSFSVQPGETLAILGPTGAGKSTIVHLLLRMYDYTQGNIYLDGLELRQLPRAWVRQQIAVVLQEPFLYSKTLRDNIRFGHSRALDEQIEAAAQAAAIHETIRNFREGYDTLLGERGITLSGGQRQRVALARAIVRDPGLLILDDALSAVDNETEALILEALQTRRGKRTTLVIAHRLTTLAHADRLIVLDHGAIIQEGTHEQLTREEGLYRRLWNIQTRLEEEFSDSLAGTKPPSSATPFRS